MIVANMQLKAVLILFLLLIPAPAFSAPPAPWEADEMIGKKAPDFTLADMKGAKISLREFKGKVVLLNFWATWCPPCKAEIPSMNRAFRMFSDKGLVILAVSSDRSKDHIERFMARMPLEFTVLPDPENEIAKIYKVFALPTSFLIDRDGMITKRVFGGREWDSAESLDTFRALIGR